MKENRHAKQHEKASPDNGRSSAQSGVRKEAQHPAEGGAGLQSGGQGNGDTQGQAVQSVQGAGKAAGGKTALRPYNTLTEDSIKGALVEARGDIFVASQLLSITAIRLDRAIRVSETLQAVVLGIQDVKGSGAYLQATAEDFGRAMERRMSLYRIAGLDALHELASMPLDQNSAQNQVKLAAAARLAGPPEGSQGGGELADTLRELNQAYQQDAPRLRVIRERLTIETIAPERVIESEAPEK